MNRHSKQLSSYLIPTVAVAFGAAALRTVAAFTQLGDYGHYNNKTLILAANAGIILCCLFALSYLFFGRADRFRVSFSSAVNYLPSGLVAIALFLIAVQLFSLSREISGLEAFAKEGYRRLEYYIAVASSLLAILSALHFFLNAYLNERKSILRGFFSIFTVLFFAAYSTLLYFNVDLPLNAPNKITDQMAFVFAALFLLYEARVSLGRDSWKGYVAFGLTGAALSAYSAIPSLIVYIFSGKELSLFPEESILMLAIFLFISFRLVYLIFSKDEGDDGGVYVLDGYAKKKATEIKDAEEIYKDAFLVQMTIDDLGSFESGAIPFLGSSEENQDNTEDTDGEETEENNEQISFYTSGTESPEAIEGSPDAAFEEKEEK